MVNLNKIRENAKIDDKELYKLKSNWFSRLFRRFKRRSYIKLCSKYDLSQKSRECKRCEIIKRLLEMD